MRCSPTPPTTPEVEHGGDLLARVLPPVVRGADRYAGHAARLGGCVMATTVKGFVPMGDRYVYDFKLCRGVDGWAQLDTRQDASYYGNWVHPTQFKLMSYSEGDVTLTECQDEADFIETLRICIDWHSEREYFIGIDAPPGRCRDELIRLGFERDLL